MTTTFRVVVFGDTYDEIVSLAESEIFSFLEVDEENVEKKVSYELLVEKDDAFDAEYIYRAEVIARIK